MKNTRIYDRVPVKDVRVKDPQIGTRTPQILISRKSGEYLRGDVLDANATTELAKSIHIPDIDKINDKLEQTVNKDQIGQPNGVAGLDSTGNVPIDQLANISTDLDTKANTSDVLLKKSASGGYYIEQNSNELGQYAFATSIACTASGIGAHAEGGATASGEGAHAEGRATASGVASHAEGYETTASGESSHAECYETTASGYCSHAEGNNTKASGVASHAEGYKTTASGEDSHAEGFGTTASRNYSHAEGNNTEASGSSSHAEGSSAKAIGVFSHAEGNDTEASGSISHAEGDNTKASGSRSHAEGVKTQASGYCSHAQGTYNVDDKNAIYSVGIGNSATRKNAEYIYAKNNKNGFSLTDDTKNGYKYLIGVGGYDGISTDNTTYKSVQEVIADLTARIEQLETKVRALEAANTPA